MATPGDQCGKGFARHALQVHGGRQDYCALPAFPSSPAKGYCPIFVSFNCAHKLQQLDRERDSIETLTRGIAISLMEVPPEETRAVACPRQVLKAYLDQHSKVVLLIDELSMLLKPGCADRHKRAGAFLRDEFLDRPDRFLVFSTHFPITAGIQELLGLGSGSDRDATPIPMPTSFNLAELREMHMECRSLTGCQVLFYSGIPSLIYSVMTDNNFKFENQFANIDPKPRVDDEFVLNFLNEFLMGVHTTTSPTAPLRSFDCLTECHDAGAGHRVLWILGYAGLVCDYIARSLPNQGPLGVGREDWLRH